MLVTPQKLPARIEIDQTELCERLHQYQLATLVSLAGDAFTINDLTLNVKMLVDGDEVFAAFETVTTDRKGRVSGVTLVELTTDATYWYVLTLGVGNELRPEQYRLHCEEDGEEYTLEPETYVANSE